MNATKLGNFDQIYHMCKNFKMSINTYNMIITHSKLCSHEIPTQYFIKINDRENGNRSVQNYQRLCNIFLLSLVMKHTSNQEWA